MPDTFQQGKKRCGPQTPNAHFIADRDENTDKKKGRSLEPPFFANIVENNQRE